MSDHTSTIQAATAAHLPAGMTAEQVTEWATAEYLAGERLAEDYFADPEIDRTSYADSSSAFKAGYLAMTDSFNDLDTVGEMSLDEVVECSLQAYFHANVAESAAEAEALLEAAATASMRPEIGHHASEELLAAAAVVERYGKFQPDGSLSPFIQRPIEVDVEDYMAAKKCVRPHALRQLREDFLSLRKNNEQRITTVTLNTSHESDPEAWQIVLVARSTGSVAYRLRGEQVWGILYKPTAWTDKVTGEVKAGWYNMPGYVGCAKVWHDYDEAVEDAAELSRALATIRRASAQRAADEEGTGIEYRRNENGELVPVADQPYRGAPTADDRL